MEPIVITIICEILAFIMLLMAMMISLAPTVRQMIPLYKFQSIALALITFITAIQFPSVDLVSRFSVFLFTLIPILLMLIIEPLLALASMQEDISTIERIKRLFNRQIIQNARRHAYPLWLVQRPSARGAFTTVMLDLALIILAFIVAFSLVPNKFTANILAISFSLLLLGLSIMHSKADIISQIMGLLVMEHGMFLAAIYLITQPIVIIAFVFSLFLYIMITLTILVFLLPDLHRISETIDIDQQEQLKG